MTSGKSSRQIHANLGHKVIDSDGHWREYQPHVMDYLKKLAGPRVAEKWEKTVSLFGQGSYARMSEQDKLDIRHGRPPWWTMPVKNTLDVATSLVPRLLYERLPEMGLDFCVLYPSGPQLVAPYLGDDELRQAGARALNTYAAEAWKDFSERCTPVGLIPMNTPEEAVAELRHCKSLGIKSVALGSLIRRPIKALEGKVSRRFGLWNDVLGIDSPYDYDPVWQACVDLGYAPSFHTASEMVGLRNSMSNFVFNHVGHFAEAGHAVAKALLLGGATRRFPQLRWAFMEGGISWGCTLLADLIGHWEKRNGKIIRDFDPSTFDMAKLAELVQMHGGDYYGGRFEEMKKTLTSTFTIAPEELDDFAPAKIQKKRDFLELYVDKYYFGCEADDPTTNYAFSRANPYGAKLKPILASDISHFDVLDMGAVLAEAWEHVEDYGMSEQDFYAFTFGNAADLWSATNPDFFKGTAVETEVAAHRAKMHQAKA